MLNHHARRVAFALAGVGTLGFFGISVDADAADWKPGKKVELIAHVKTSSSTYAFASAVFNAARSRN